MAVSIRTLYPAGNNTATTSGGPVISVTTASVAAQAGDTVLAHAVMNSSNDTGITLSATYNGQPADYTSTVVHSNGQSAGMEQFFYWVDPGGITGSVVTTASSSTNNSGWCQKVYVIAGSDQAQPTFTTNSGSGTNCSVTSPSIPTGGLGIAGFCGGVAFSSTGQTQTCLGNNGTGVDAASCIAGCSAAGADATVDFTATLSGTDWWGATAVAIAAPAMTAPTFVAARDTTTAWTSPGTSKATAAFDALAGDRLVVVAANENGNAFTWSGISNNNGALTWNPEAGASLSNDSLTQCETSTWTTTVDTDRLAAEGDALVVTITTANNTKHWGFTVLQFRDSDGYGATDTENNGTGSGAPTMTTVLTGDNSALVVLCADWNATTGSRTYTQINGANPTEDIHAGTAGGDYIVNIFHYADCGAAGSKVSGISSPNTQRYVIGGVEVLGTATVVAPNTGEAVAGTVGWAGVASGTNLAVPGNFTATVNGTSEIDLDWNAVTGAQGYHVYRDDVLVHTTDAATTAWNDTGLDPATEYCYRVAAFR